MQILLTGAGGQFGRAFLGLASRRHELAPVFHRATEAGGGLVGELRDPDQLPGLVRRQRPDWIVHAAAMTNVDACERNPSEAHAVNAEATGALARAAAQAGSRLLFVSTDYVFDGRKGHYSEEDAPAPINVYGRTKLEGERLARSAASDTVVARTSVLFGSTSKNFVGWVLGELKGGRSIRVVDDQWVSPTYAPDLAQQVLALVEAKANGLFHTAGRDRLSRLEMARAIARRFRLPESLIEPVPSARVGWLAPRPRDSSLRVEKVGRYKAPWSFEESLVALQEEIGSSESS